MNSSSPCFMLLTLCLILISMSTNARAGDGANMIGYICNQTNQDEIMDCTNILKADPSILGAKNFTELVLKLALNNTIEGQNFLKGMVKTKYVPAIADCANLWYGMVVASFRDALSELKSDPLSANYEAKVAGDGSATCDRELAATHVVNPAISALNHQTSLLSYIAFLATNEIPTQP